MNRNFPMTSFGERHCAHGGVVPQPNTSSLQIAGLKALVGLHGRMDGRIRAVLLAEQVGGRV
ncbi:MAG: hypothetical protein V3U93_10885, partial [Alphaproteobacteria bacterium]